MSLSFIINKKNPLQVGLLQYQLGLRYSPALLYSGTPRIDTRQTAGAAGVYQEDGEAADIVDAFHNLAYDGYGSQGKQRLGMLVKRKTPKPPDYDSEEYLSEAGDQDPGLRIEYQE